MFEGSITALITPFKKDLSVDLECYKKLIQLQNTAKSDGIVVAGTTGEVPTLTREEFESLVDTAIETAADYLPVIVNAGTYSTQDSVSKAEYAKQKGADAVLVIVPYYSKPSLRGIFQHFEAIAKVGLPIILYHQPHRTGVFLEIDTILQLAEFDEIVAVKESSGDIYFAKELIQSNPKANILTGNDTLALEFIEYGGKGAISVIGNLTPEYWKEVIHVALSGEYEVAEDLLENIRTLLWAIELEPNPQGIKCACNLAGLCENILRLPMVSADQENQREIQSSMEELGIQKSQQSKANV